MDFGTQLVDLLMNFGIHWAQRLLHYWRHFCGPLEPPTANRANGNRHEQAGNYWHMQKRWIERLQSINSNVSTASSCTTRRSLKTGFGDTRAAVKPTLGSQMSDSGKRFARRTCIKKNPSKTMFRRLLSIKVPIEFPSTFQTFLGHFLGCYFCKL